MERNALRRGRRRAFTLLLLVLLGAVSLPLLPARPVHAALTFTVNLTGDAPDLNPADNLCDASAGAGQQCTLRAAIQQSNAAAGRDTIRFNIPGGGLKTIKPGAELPAITKPVTIDGYTQPGATPNTATTGTNAAIRIELDGTNVFPAPSLSVQGANSIVRGLAINRFGAQITLFAGDGARIEGCFLGTNAAGTVARGTGARGTQILSANNVLGGTTPAARNLISGNGISGIDVFGDNNRIEGNLTGTAKDGVSPLRNGIVGVTVSASGTTIGGAAAAANVIAFNGDDGVQVVSGTGNRILRNAIFTNGGLGIDLGSNGADPNDPDDADTGPNNLQNTPVLTSAATVGTTTIVEGHLNSTPDRTFVVRFYSNAVGDEGQVFRGQIDLRTNADGNATFSFSPVAAIPTGHRVTSTATSAAGDTSEFSPPTVV